MKSRTPPSARLHAVQERDPDRPGFTLPDRAVLSAEPAPSSSRRNTIKVSTIVLHKAALPFPNGLGPDGRRITYDPQEALAKEILYKLDTGTEFAELAKVLFRG